MTTPTNAPAAAAKKTPQTADEMIVALTESLALARRVSVAETMCGASPFDAKLAALDAAIASLGGAR